MKIKSNTKLPTFSVLSYNILSDDLANPEYINVAPKFLNNKSRVKLLLKKLANHIDDSAIFCFQEVSGTQLSALCRFFYDHHFYYVGIGDLAIFFHCNTFTMKGVHGNNFPSVAKSGELASIFTTDELQTLSTRKKYFLGVHLKHTATGQSITVVTTHIIANPKLNDLKVLQIIALIQLFQSGPTVICGDFNSLPSSDQIKAITNGKISIGCTKLSGNERSCSKIKFRALQPVYKQGITTHTSNKTTPTFSEMVDHIFYSSELTVISRLPLMAKSTATTKSPLPDSTEPSDHCMIGATFHYVRSTVGEH